jgi:hypothetical protein
MPPADLNSDYRLALWPLLFLRPPRGGTFPSLSPKPALDLKDDHRPVRLGHVEVKELTSKLGGA